MRDAYSESGTSAGAAAPELAAFLTRTARPLIPGRACRPGRAASRSAVDVRARRRRQSRVAAGALLALASLFAGAMDARAQTDITLVSNLNQGDDESVTRGGRIAQVFTTGSDARGYRLSSVDVISEDSDSDSFSLSVCSVGTDTHPTTTCTTFTAPSSFAAGTLSFTAPADTVLEANTDYAVVVTATGNSVTYDTTEANGEDSGAATGWSIQDFYKFVNSSNAWENTNSGAALRIAIKGTPNLHSDAKLSGLRLSHGGTDIALDPAFDPDTDTYTATVTGTTEITITPVTRSGVATYEFRTADNSAAIADASGAAGFQMRLLDGENDIRVQVTAEDGTTENFYILTVTSIPGVSIRTVNAGGDAIAGIDNVNFLVTRTGTTAEALTVSVRLAQDQSFLPDSELSRTVTIAEAGVRRGGAPCSC